MSGADFFSLTLAVQAALGAGYLGYATAYAGFRRDHRSEDTVFISLAFAAFGYAAFGLVAPKLGPLAGVLAAFGVALSVAAFWRALGRRVWLWFMGAAKVHREDGVHGGWAAILQSQRAVGQISVHLKSGRVLYLNDRPKYFDRPWDGLYLGSDGSVIMVVEEEELPDGTTEERAGIFDPDWGTRLTYIPAGEVGRVNIRLK